MEKIFKLDIVTPKRTVYRGEAVSLIAPGELGYLGILANHAPLITNLVPGKIILKETGDRYLKFYSPGKGFLYVINNSASLILDSIS
jgi:F-type H+-transporting ATPase subunit epsilon